MKTLIFAFLILFSTMASAQLDCNNTKFALNEDVFIKYGQSFYRSCSGVGTVVECRESGSENNFIYRVNIECQDDAYSLFFKESQLTKIKFPQFTLVKIKIHIDGICRSKGYIRDYHLKDSKKIYTVKVFCEVFSDKAMLVDVLEKDLEKIKKLN